MDDRQALMRDDPQNVPEDFLTLLIRSPGTGRSEF
jgi:hypothetical protein